MDPCIYKDLEQYPKKKKKIPWTTTDWDGIYNQGGMKGSELVVSIHGFSVFRQPVCVEWSFIPRN